MVFVACLVRRVDALGRRTRGFRDKKARRALADGLIGDVGGVFEQRGGPHGHLRQVRDARRQDRVKQAVAARYRRLARADEATGDLHRRLTAAEIAQEDGYLLIGYPANEIAPADTRADSERDGREQIGVGNGGLAGRRALTSPDVQHHQRTVAVGGAGGSQLQAEGAKEPLAVQQEIGENDLPAQRVRIVHLGRRAPGVRSVERWSLPRVKPQGIASPRVEQVVPPENP